MVIFHDPKCAEYGSAMRPEQPARVLRKKRMKYFYAASSALAALFVLLLTIEFVQRGMVA